MGVNLTDNFKESIEMFIKYKQTVRGYIQSNDIDHTGPMRVLVLTEPDSKPTQMALKFFINNYIEDYEISEYEIEEVSVGVLALYEYNALIYSDIIKNLISRLVCLIFNDGKIINRYFTDICTALQIFSRFMDFQDEIIREGIIVHNQTFIT